MIGEAVGRPAAAAHGRVRRRRIWLSYATAGISKSAAAIVQLSALPIVAFTLGAERFGALLVLGAVGAVACLPARAIVPAASIGIARARGRGDLAAARAEAWSACLLSIALGIAAMLAVAGAAFVLDPSVLFGRASPDLLDEARGGIAAILLLIFATYFLAWVEGVRTGYEENHLNNLFSLIGSAAALAGIGLAWAFSPNIPAFFVATYVLYPLVQGVNLAFLPRERWSGPDRRPLDRQTAAGTMRRALGWSVAQGGVALHLQGSIYLAAQAFGLSAGALVGGMVRLFQILHGFLLALLNPVLPTLSHAAASGDRAWLFEAGRRTAVFILGGLSLIGIAIAVGGGAVMKHWLGLAPADDALLFAAFGAMAAFHMGAQLYYLMLLALGDGRRPSQHLLVAGLGGLGAGLVAMQDLGLAGLLWAQAAAMLVIGFAPIALRLAARLGSWGGAAPR